MSNETGPYLREIPISFVGGPMDGDGTLEIRAPGALEIRTMEVQGHPEGFYKLLEDGKFHWLYN